MSNFALAYLINASGMVDRAASTYGDPRIQEIVQELGSRFAAMADERGLSNDEALAAAAGVAAAVGVTVQDCTACDHQAFRAAFLTMTERGLQNASK